jgi:hypothetical protein
LARPASFDKLPGPLAQARAGRMLAAPKSERTPL